MFYCLCSEESECGVNVCCYECSEYENCDKACGKSNDLTIENCMEIMEV